MFSHAVTARLEGRWTRLRPATPDDLPLMYRMLTEPSVGYRYGFYGAVPSFEEFTRRAWESVAGQWIAERRDGRPVGLAVLASADYRNGTAFFSIVSVPEVRGSGLMIDAAGSFFSYVFFAFPFRRLYADVAAENLRQFRRATDQLLEIEGCRRQAIWMGGGFQDLFLLAISRERWQAVGEPTRDRLIALGQRRVSR